MDLAFFFREVRTPGHGRDHGHRMHEENDVEEKYVGNGPAQHDLTIGTGGRVAGPKRKPEGHQRPEAALLTGTAPGSRQSDAGGREHQRQDQKVRKYGERKAGASKDRHTRKGQSDSGRCDKPTVSLEQTHPTQFYGT